MVLFCIIARGLLHLQVQPIPGIGVGARQIFVNLDTQPRRIRQADMALFNLDRAFDQRVMERCFDGFGQ